MTAMRLALEPADCSVLADWLDLSWDRLGARSAPGLAEAVA
jgi:hypothetical protein